MPTLQIYLNVSGSLQDKFSKKRQILFKTDKFHQRSSANKNKRHKIQYQGKPFFFHKTLVLEVLKTVLEDKLAGLGAVSAVRGERGRVSQKVTIADSPYRCIGLYICWLIKLSIWPPFLARRKTGGYLADEYRVFSRSTYKSNTIRERFNNNKKEM